MYHDAILTVERHLDHTRVKLDTKLGPVVSVEDSLDPIPTLRIERKAGVIEIEAIIPMVHLIHKEGGERSEKDKTSR